MRGRYRKVNISPYGPVVGGRVVRDLLVASNHATSTSDEESKGKCKDEEALTVNILALLGPYAVPSQSFRLASKRENI